MKKNHGKIIFIIFTLLLSILHLDAKEYTWAASINKKSAFINEAIYIKYTCTFVDRSELYVIEFAPKSNDMYEIVSLSQSESIKDYKRINTYEYIVFAKKSGRLDLTFDVVMKKTNKDSIENTVLGRDNAQFEEFSITKLKQKELSIDIKPTTHKLVGEFKIKVKQDEPKIKAYEPYHFYVSIEGLGDLENISEFDFNTVDAEVFASKAQKKYQLTKDGYKGVWSQKFAFVSKKDFTLPAFKIEYLNPHDGLEKVLEVKQTEVKVSKAYEKIDLLDEVDEEGFELKAEYLYYLLTFIAGFLAAKVRFKVKQSTDEKDTFNDKIKKAKNLDELLMLLIVKNSKKYGVIIKDIENKKLNSISDVKRALEI